ncbi:hypothetical protein A1O3_00415, partial [Capronia epimyces CBS 606.96]
PPFVPAREALDGEVSAIRGRPTPADLGLSASISQRIFRGPGIPTSHFPLPPVCCSGQPAVLAILTTSLFQYE